MDRLPPIPRETDHAVFNRWVIQDDSYRRQRPISSRSMLLHIPGYQLEGKEIDVGRATIVKVHSLRGGASTHRHLWYPAPSLHQLSLSPAHLVRSDSAARDHANNFLQVHSRQTARSLYMKLDTSPTYHVGDYRRKPSWQPPPSCKLHKYIPKILRLGNFVKIWSKNLIPMRGKEVRGLLIPNDPSIQQDLLQHRR